MPTTYNKVTLDGDTLIDLSQDTVSSAADIVTGKVGHLNDGSQVTGTAPTGSTPAISVVDTLDSHGGTVRTITGLDISDTTATASDVALGKNFYMANGVKTTGTGTNSSGASTLSGLTDINIQSVANNQVLQYNGTTEKWSNISPPWAEITEITSDNIFNPNDSNIIMNAAFLPWDGSLMQYGGMFCTYIPCEIGTYTFLSPSWFFEGNVNRVPLFDSNKTYIGEISGNHTTYDNNSEIITISISSTEITNGCAYFGFSQGTSSINNLMVVKGTTYPSTYIPFGTTRTIEGLQITKSQIVDLDSVNNPLSGKIASFNGDSICAGAGFSGGYASIIGTENNMIIDNIAVGGATITPITGPAHIISTSIGDMRSDADYIILEGGVNDSDVSVPVGTLTSGYSDTLDTTTFAGAFENMLKSAITRYPGKKIGYIFVHKCGNFGSSYYNIAKTACEKWGIPYLDLYTQIPSLAHIDALRTAYTSNGDGYHPNEDGYTAYYVPKITAWMKTL